MLLTDDFVRLPPVDGQRNLLQHVRQHLELRYSPSTLPIRMAITRSGPEGYDCEVGLIEGYRPEHALPAGGARSIFDFRRRPFVRTRPYTGAFIVPTGIGCEIGGHAGDATPALRLVAGACDRLVTHPNVVNASDLNEMPENTLYVEGSVLTRILMGTAGVVPVDSNRILTVTEEREEDIFVNNVVNAVNAARGSAGFRADDIAGLSPRMTMRIAYGPSGRAGGSVEGFDRLCRIIDSYHGRIDAVAITTVIDVPRELHDAYFERCDEIVNPWGGVEALLTHALSHLYDLPAAHAPMYENEEIMNEDPGVMDPRLAAEGISVAFLHCVLKGLHRSPRVIRDPALLTAQGVLGAADMSFLVIPDHCLGLPTIAALEQGIPVIAVRENGNKMKNDLESLPWQPGQLHIVESYLEAAGTVLALREGVAPASVRRPFPIASYVGDPRWATRAPQRPVDQGRREEGGARAAPEASQDDRPASGRDPAVPARSSSGR